MTDSDVLTEVPESLKRLVRYIVRGFYSIEHAIVIDVLVHHPCIKEDDILELLKFERKQLRTLLNSLKADKFLKVRMRVEIDAEGKTTRHNYYFINYSTFVNVVKYKLDHVQRKIETEERDSTSRASFKCNTCEKTYTDLEVDHLLDPMTGSLKCTYCQDEVEMENVTTAKPDARTLMVKFNEQMEPIYALLREVEDIKLAAELLEPEPKDLKMARPHGSSSSRGPGDPNTWSGDATKNKDYFGFTENQVTVDMSGDSALREAAKKETKVQPIWMMESTVEGAVSEARERKETAIPASASSASLSQDSEDIMRTLLMHEKKTDAAPIVTGIPGAAAGSDDGGGTSSSDSEDDAVAAIIPSSSIPIKTAVSKVEEMESESEEEEAMVTVAGHKVPYHEVKEDMVAKMTPQEKEDYIRIGQEMYSNMYD